MEPEWLLLLWVRVDLGAMSMKEYSTHPRTPEPEANHWIQLSIISRTVQVFKIVNILFQAFYIMPYYEIQNGNIYR